MSATVVLVVVLVMEGVGMVATNSANSANSDAANSSNFDKSERDSSTISESSNSSSGGKLDSNEKNSSNKVLDTKDINYDVVGNRNSINHISNTFGSHTISTIDNNNTAIDDGNSDSNDVIPPMKITDSCLSVKPNTGTGTDSIGMEDDGSSQMKKKKEVRFADDTNPPPLDTVALSITNYKCIDKKYINYTIKVNIAIYLSKYCSIRQWMRNIV